jgi:peroxiredoxin
VSDPNTTTPDDGVSLLPAGTPAPDFTLKQTPDSDLSLSDLRGKPAILVFYPADWSSVCGDQLALYNEVLPEFERLGAQIVGISVDSKWCHKAYVEARNLRFPLLADFHPKGAMGKAYGAYDESKGTESRSLFVIDAEGVIRWSYRSPNSVNPGANGILEALDRLTVKS